MIFNKLRYFKLIMLNRFIPLKRNVILLQLPVILPMIILSGFIAYFIHSLGLKNWDKTFLSIMFVIYIIVSVRIYLENKNFIQFSNNEIIECKKNKNGVKILKTYNVDAIKSIVCDDKKKRIKFFRIFAAQNHNGSRRVSKSIYLE